MLIEELCAYADKRMELPPPGYRKQVIHYVVDIDASGNFQSINVTGVRGRSSTPSLELMTPYLKRQGQKPPPVLFADLAGRTLGITYKEGKEDWCRERHAEYVQLVAECGKRTKEPSVHAVKAFLESNTANSDYLPADLDADGVLTFRVNGIFPTELPSVRSYWADLTGAEGDTADGVCAVCGESRSIVRIHPLKIKGVVGGQRGGTDLVSANNSAGWSYGLKNSLIFPTCYDCAWRYANALNALLASPESHLRLAGADYVYWTLEETGFNPIRFLTDPNPQEVAELLRAPFFGNQGPIDIEGTAFFALSLRGSGGRTCVRSWLSTTVEDARLHIARYFALQEIEDPYGTLSSPLPLRFLTGATVRDPRKDDPPAAIPDSLITLALAGTPLPDFVLAQAVQRCRASQGVSRERAALIKMALASRSYWSTERTHAMSGLDTSNQDPAYLCGRLLAELNEIQRQALGQTNATVIDKFYGSASSAPASVFGNLLDNAQNHLSKLRKSREGAANALDARLMEIMDGLDSFPKTLTLPEQAMFALGFYHQRAADRRAARERKEARDAASTEGDPVSLENDAA